MSSHRAHTHDLTTIRGRVELLVHRVIRPWRKLSAKSRAAVWLCGAAAAAFFIAILIIGPKAIGQWVHGLGQWFHGMALGLRDMGWVGLLLIMLAVIASSHPPLFGFSISMSMIGFAYGLAWGLVIGSVASLIGGALAWYSIRTFFLERMRSFGASKNKQWTAFGHVMREKGWPLVAMIRWCPLPWAIGNGLFASVDGIEFWHFMLANLLFLPRLLIPVFIGSRLNNMTDDAGEEESDPVKFWVNLISIIISLGVSAGTGILIYRLTLEQMRKLEQCEGGDHDLAIQALEEAALLGDYSDEDAVNEELVPMRPTNEQV